jgi:hypothetical protein
VLDKVGHFLLNDKMTLVNMNFVADVCYKAMDRLQESVQHETPHGLEEFGDWRTLYPGLTLLPEPARTSWFSFDQFYSTAAFADALPIVFAAPRRHILDVGGNTGAWAAACTARDPTVRVTIVAPSGTGGAADEALRQSPHRDRIAFWPADVLDASQPWPSDADAIWMSQFLDCFAEDQIAAILARRPRAPARRLSVRARAARRSSAARRGRIQFECHVVVLYLHRECVSRMCRSDDLERLLRASGLEIEAQHDNLGSATRCSIASNTDERAQRDAGRHRDDSGVGAAALAAAPDAGALIAGLARAAPASVAFTEVRFSSAARAADRLRRAGLPGRRQPRAARYRALPRDDRDSRRRRSHRTRW